MLGAVASRSKRTRLQPSASLQSPPVGETEVFAVAPTDTRVTAGVRGPATSSSAPRRTALPHAVPLVSVHATSLVLLSSNQNENASLVQVFQ